MSPTALAILAAVIRDGIDAVRCDPGSEHRVTVVAIAVARCTAVSCTATLRRWPRSWLRRRAGSAESRSKRLNPGRSRTLTPMAFFSSVTATVDLISSLNRTLN